MNDNNFVKKSSVPVMAKLITPDFYYPNIHIEANPLIKIGQDQLAESQKMNASFIALNERIDELETNAVISEKKNHRRQWIIAITSTLIGVVVGFAMNFLIF